CKIWYLIFRTGSEDDAHRGKIDDRSAAPSPSSPRLRRALPWALGLDRSARPSKPATVPPCAPTMLRTYTAVVHVRKVECWLHNGNRAHGRTKCFPRFAASFKRMACRPWQVRALRMLIDKESVRSSPYESLSATRAFPFAMMSSGATASFQSRGSLFSRGTSLTMRLHSWRA